MLSEPSHKRTLSRLLIAAVASAVLTASAAAAPHVDAVPDRLASPRVFTRGSFVYVVDAAQIVFMSMDTRGAHTLYTASDTIFNITDAVRYDDMIWASNGAGAVMAVNMQTGTIEEFGRSRVAPAGRIDVDRHYVWLAAGDTLYRMSTASREWVSIPIENIENEKARAVVSFNDQIHVVTSGAVRIFRPLTGDWSSVPHPRFTLGASDFHRVDNICYFTYGKNIYRYDPARRQWNRGTVKDEIGAVSLTPELLIIAARDRLYHYDPNRHTLDPQPTTPKLRGIRAVTRHDGRTAAVINGGIALFNSPFDFDFAAYPDYIESGDGVTVFSYDNHVLIYSAKRLIVYNPGRKLWSTVPVVRRSGEPAAKTGWDKDGARGHLTEEHSYALTGQGTGRNISGNDNDEGALDMGPPLANITLNAHVTDMEGRFLDLTIDNAVTTIPPQKGFYYKGAEGDYLNRAVYGVRHAETTPSRVIPEFVSEGGSAVFTSREKVADGGDRHRLTSSAGGGAVLSRTFRRSFRYNSGDTYHLHPDERFEIISSSVKVYVDGAPLSSTDYIYNASNQSVRILRRDRTDPTSIISVSYSAKILPDRPVAFEIFPENHDGRYIYMEGGVSPRSWLNAYAGVMAIDREGAFSFSEASGAPISNNIIYAGMPTEWRAGGRSVTVRPEIAYDNIAGAHSGAVEIGVRENRAFGSYGGFWSGRDFWALDQPTFSARGNRLSEDHEIDFGYDIRDDLRLSWRQIHRRSAEDSSGISMFELRGAYVGNILPDVELSASTRLFERDYGRPRSERKETASLRVSDMSSSYLTRKSRMHNIGYDFSFTEYWADAGQNGRTFYGMASASPIEKLTLTGTGLYRVNPENFQTLREINPTFAINARDLPAGVDAQADYSVSVDRHADENNTIRTRRNLAGYFYPGEYVKTLDRLSIFMKYYDYWEARDRSGGDVLKYSLVSGGDPSFRDIWETAGVAVFPVDNLLLTSMFERNHGTNVPTTYHLYERARWWFKSGSALEGNAAIVKHPLLLHLHANAIYEHRWSENLMTGAGAFGTRHSENFEVRTEAGPRFTVSLTKPLNGFIRAVESYHYLRVIGHQDEPLSPSVEYITYLRLQMPPNMSFVCELHAVSEKKSAPKGSGAIYLHIGF